MSSPHIPPKPQALSHMLWFFVFPAVGFMLWASVRLIQGALKPSPSDVFTKLERVEKARNPGDRWQAAYVLSQELQKMIHDQELSHLDTAKKDRLYAGLEDLLRLHQTDSRLKRYLLLTLGQMGDARALVSLERGIGDKDSEIRFYSAWGFLDILSKHRENVTPARLKEIEGWTQDSDVAFRKISGTFLVQLSPPDLVPVEKLLKDSNAEVRWNTAVALASIGKKEAAPVLQELFDLPRLRGLELHNSKDLERLVATAYGAAKKLGDVETLNKANRLRASVNPRTPEGHAIVAALR